jgi:hypothetical protein
MGKSLTWQFRARAGRKSVSVQDPSGPKLSALRPEGFYTKMLFFTPLGQVRLLPALEQIGLMQH